MNFRISALKPTLKTTTACSLLLALLMLTQAPQAKAQFDDAGEILRAGASDSNLLLENYMKPFGAGFGADLNSGWVNTARPYRTLGFDLRFNAAVSIVPDTDQIFTVQELAFQEIEHLGGSPNTPTINGNNSSDTRLGKMFEYEDPNTGEMISDEELFSFVMPQGIGYPFVPAPMVQLTVGVIRDTDISVRYFPTVDVPDVATIDLWGLGFKHGLNQWFPSGDMLPVDLSVQFGYTDMNVQGEFDVQPVIDELTDVPPGFERNAPQWDGQGIVMESRGITGNLLVGKTIPLISIFGGVGFQTSRMNIRTPGSFPLTAANPVYANDPANNRPKTIEAMDQPIDLNLDGENSLHAMAGFRFRLAILTISGSYTFANYSTANLGVGISFR